MSERKRRRLREPRAVDPRKRLFQDIRNGAPARVMRAVTSDLFDADLAQLWAYVWCGKLRRRSRRRLDDEERAIVRAAARNWPGPWQPLLQVVYDANDAALAADLCALYEFAPHLFLRAAFAVRSSSDAMDNGVRSSFFVALARRAVRRAQSMLALNPMRTREFNGRTAGLVGAWWDLETRADATAKVVPQHFYNDIPRLLRCPYGAHELRVLLCHWGARIRGPSRQTVGERVAEHVRNIGAYETSGKTAGRALRTLWLETLYAVAPLPFPVHVLDELVRCTFPAPFARLLAIYCPPVQTVSKAQAARDFFHR